MKGWYSLNLHPKNKNSNKIKSKNYSSTASKSAKFARNVSVYNYSDKEVTIRTNTH